MGCADATRAPISRKGASSSLVRAPLECSAIFPFQSWDRASVSGHTGDGVVRNGDPDNVGVERMLAQFHQSRLYPPRQSLVARVAELFFRTAMNRTSYPAEAKVSASALPRLPGPTILIVGRSLERFGWGTAGRIADSRHRNRGPLCLILIVMPTSKRATRQSTSAKPSPASKEAVGTQGPLLQSRLPGAGLPRDLRQGSGAEWGHGPARRGSPFRIGGHPGSR